MSTRICIIGAGPSSLSVLHAFHKTHTEGTEIPEIVCYEKQNAICGMWNYTWRTGVDANGELLPNSMYHNLWSNGPKEVIEYADYTFEEHFGHPIPSFPPRKVLRDYLEGRANQGNLTRFIKLNHVVTHVAYHPETDDFTVDVKDVSNGTTKSSQQRFNYVINCISHFSVPHTPDFPGLNEFNGRVLHSHDVRDVREFASRSVLVIGSSYSAEDMVLQCFKYGAARITCSWRTKPMPFKFPEKITQKPLVTNISGNTVTFKDGTSGEFDAIILATGYLHHYPYFTDDSLRLQSENNMYPDNLYKGVLWLNGGGRKLFYVGAQDLYYSFTMFDVQGLWVRNVIMNRLKIPKSEEEMREDNAQWIQRKDKVVTCYEGIDFQTAYVLQMAKEVDYPYNIDSSALLKAWEDSKDVDILTYRDQCYECLFTKTIAPEHKDKWLDAMDDSLEYYVAVNK